MATLYLAEKAGAAGFQRKVAVKVIHDHLARDQSLVQMLVEEAKIASRITHPNVVHIEELGEHEGRLYIAMEYVPGWSLAEIVRSLALRKRRMAEPLACYIALAVADGLRAAHNLRDEDGVPLEVVHRDVSPQNVLLSTDGHVKLIDFGVAKARGRNYQTATGMLKGKLGYMSPEQACGEALDHRTDIYALGIVLWELLCMRRRFHSSNQLKLLQKVQRPSIITPSDIYDDLSPAIDEVVVTALALNPEGRYDTTGEFRAALAKACPAAASIDAGEVGELFSMMMVTGDKSALERAPVFTSLTALTGSDATFEGIADDASSYEEVPRLASRPEAQRVREPIAPIALDQEGDTIQTPHEEHANKLAPEATAAIPEPLDRASAEDETFSHLGIRKRPSTALIVGGIALFGIVAGVFTYFGSGSRQDEPEAAMTEDATNEHEDVETPTLAAAPPHEDLSSRRIAAQAERVADERTQAGRVEIPPGRAPPSKNTPPAQERVTIRFRTVPEGASLRLDGEPLSRIGEASFQLGTTHRITASAAGYSPARLSFRADRDRELVVRLRRPEPPPPPAMMARPPRMSPEGFTYDSPYE